MMETVASVAKRAREAGKYAAIYVTDTKIAGRFVDMGYRLLATGQEQQLISMGASSLLADLKKSIG
jgi:4-hydroxy-2-oxoheptanedioate aldolase